MQESDELIDVFDETDKKIGAKPRKDIDKKRDIVKGVNIILVNAEGKVFLTRPVNAALSGKWASSAAGMVRSGETAAAAARRTVERELGIRVALVAVGEQAYNLAGVRKFATFFTGKTILQPRQNPQDVQEGKWVTIEEADSVTNTGDCLLTLPLLLAALKAKQKRPEF